MNRALIFAVPVITALAIADEPPIVATATLSEDHVAELLMSWVDESLNTPVAVYWICHPIGTSWAAGVILIELMVALVTFN